MTASDGKTPVKGARLTVLDNGENPTPVTPDAAGRFKFDAEPDHKYRFQAFAPNLVGFPTEFAAHEGENAVSPVRLYRPQALRVAITEAGPSAGALANVRVEIFSMGGDYARAETGADGSAVIEGLSPGTYEIRVQKTGFRPAVVQGEVTKEKLSAEKFIDLWPSTAR